MTDLSKLKRKEITMDAMQENLVKARHDIYFVSDSLRSALHYADATEGIILLDLIKRVGEIAIKIVEFHNAYNVDNEED